MADFERRDDHIGIFHDAVPDELIDIILKNFDYYQELRLDYSRNNQSKDSLDENTFVSYLDKKDQSTNLASLPYVLEEHWRFDKEKSIFDLLNTEIIPMYKESYGMRDDIDLISMAGKIQKTQKGGGYHIWHYESGSLETNHRALAWMVYLNDVEEGGETEFLNQHCRFKPTKGTLLVWPASFTHIHRGNPPLSGDKYILTGWTDYDG